MIKKTIKYTDYDGNERSEDFYFNLTKAEVMEMELGETGGMQKMLERIVSEQDGKKISEMFKMIILKSYGKKSPDGRRFMKKDSEGRSLSAEFEETEAYSELWMELATNADAASAFINGVMPQIPQQGNAAIPPKVG